MSFGPGVFLWKRNYRKGLSYFRTEAKRLMKQLWICLLKVIRGNRECQYILIRNAINAGINIPIKMDGVDVAPLFLRDGREAG